MALFGAVQAITAKIMALPGNTMNRFLKQKLLYIFSLLCYIAAQDLDDLEFKVNGLTAEVEILVDRWGVSHIYADNERDLFFAQGFNDKKLDTIMMQLKYDQDTA